MTKRIEKTGIHFDLPVQVTETSLTFLAVDYDQWAECGRALAKCKEATQFWIGDWLEAGEQRWGEKYSQAASETGINPQRLMQLKFVASRIPAGSRLKELSWTHHKIVASAKGLTDVKRQAWLRIAQKRNLTTRELEDAIRQSAEKKIVKEDFERSNSDSDLGAEWKPYQPMPTVMTTEQAAVVRQALNGTLDICVACNERPATHHVCQHCAAIAQREHDEQEQKKRGGDKHGKSKDAKSTGSPERQDHQGS